MGKIKVLYIAGLGRSGSTLVDRLLGEVDGFVSVGELRHIWARSYQDNQLCGCHNSFSDCGTWKSISKRAFPDGLTKETLNKVIHLHEKLNRIRNIPLLNLLSFSSDVNEYIEEFLCPLYTAIQNEFTGHIIVDSSKVPSYLYILNKCNFIDLSVVHVVRDPRAVAFSWLRKKIRPEVTNRDEYMPTINIYKISVMWILFNYLIKRLGGLLGKSRYMIVSYENFSKDPYGNILGILKFMGSSENVSFFKDSHSVLLKQNHSVSGNPMRFKSGLVTIRSDEQWKTSMGKFDKLLVSLITLFHRTKFLST